AALYLAEPSNSVNSTAISASPDVRREISTSAFTTAQSPRSNPPKQLIGSSRSNNNLVQLDTISGHDSKELENEKLAEHPSFIPGRTPKEIVGFQVVKAI